MSVQSFSFMLASPSHFQLLLTLGSALAVRSKLAIPPVCSFLPPSKIATRYFPTVASFTALLTVTPPSCVHAVFLMKSILPIPGGGGGGGGAEFVIPPPLTPILASPMRSTDFP